MPVHFATPSKTLAPYIKRYWAIENVLDKGEICVQRIIPTGLTELQLYLSKRPKMLTDNKYLSDNIALYGHQNDFYDMEMPESLSIFSIVFQPQGLMQFFKFPLNEICNQNVSLKNINGQAARDLEEKMNEVPTFQQKVNVVETCLFDLLKNNFDNFEFRRMSHIAELIKQTYGNININQMASETCLSRKQFERIFAGQIGISPKQYLKIIRFQSAIFQKQQKNSLTMTELSYESGYFDQSHFINDFKSMCGLTPRIFRRQWCLFGFFCINSSVDNWRFGENRGIVRPKGNAENQRLWLTPTAVNRSPSSSRWGVVGKTRERCRQMPKIE